MIAIHRLLAEWQKADWENRLVGSWGVPSVGWQLILFGRYNAGRYNAGRYNAGRYRIESTITVCMGMTPEQLDKEIRETIVHLARCERVIRGAETPHSAQPTSPVCGAPSAPGVRQLVEAGQ